MVSKSDLQIGYEFEFIAPFDKITLKKKIKKDLGIVFSGVKSEKWKLTWDTSVSVKGLSKYYSHELVSPPQTYFEAIETLKKVFQWMKENKCRTNRTCSLQVNISFHNAEYTKRINLLKLLLLYPEIKILKTFHRTRNYYCESQRKRLEQYNLSKYERQNLITNKNIEEFFISKVRIAAYKFQSMNITKWKRKYNRYIEFRGIGNKNYEYQETIIKKYIDSIACAMLYSISKASHTSEYIAWLKALITPRRKYFLTKKGTYYV